MLWLGLAALSSFMLFHTSQKVTDGRQELARLNKDIQREEESLRVFQAEWSYLNQPERLEKLARQHLQLEPLKGRQFTIFKDLRESPPPAPAVPAPDETLLAVDEAPTTETATEAKPAEEETVATANEAETEEAKNDTGETVYEYGRPEMQRPKPETAAAEEAESDTEKAIAAEDAKDAKNTEDTVDMTIASTLVEKPAVAKPAGKTAVPVKADKTKKPAKATAPATAGRGFNDVMKGLGVQ